MYRLSITIALYLVALVAGAREELTQDEYDTFNLHRYCSKFTMENRPSNRQGVTKPVLEVHCPLSDGTKALTNVARLPLDWCLGWNTTSLKPQKMYVKSALFIIISKRSSSFLVC